MKDKSIKSTMKSWIMLSDKELDDTQVYMQEQEQQNSASREEQVEQLIEKAGEEVIDPETAPLKRKRRKRHQSEKEKPETREEKEEQFMSEGTKESMSDMTKEKEVMAAEVEKVTGSTDDNGNKADKGGGVSKMLVGGIGVLLVLIIAGLGYQTQSLQKQNQKLKTEPQRHDESRLRGALLGRVLRRGAERARVPGGGRTRA